MTRRPAVAGMFYSGDKSSLLSEIRRIAPSGGSRLPCIGAVVPHAGYIYSGAIAGELYAQIEIPDTVVILGPSHRGPLVPFAVSPDDEWMTPLGNVRLDKQFAGELMKISPYATEDAAPHLHEHSIEVQVPFLQFINPNVQIVPVLIAEDDPDVLIEFGGQLARCIIASAKPVLIIASSDMTHFETATAAKTQDDLALARILELDASGLHTVVRRNRISMCGVSPTTAMLAAAADLGARSAELVRYGNSGEVTGDYSSVVGYASVRVY